MTGVLDRGWLMRILLVSQYFWPESFRINDLALGLQALNHQVTVLTGVPNYPSGRFFPGYNVFAPRDEMFQGLSVRRVPLIPRGRGPRWQLALNYLSFAFVASLLGPWRCRESYDVIFVYEPSPITVGIPAVVLKKLKDIPMLFWVQDLWPESLSATGAVQSAQVLRLVARLTRCIYRHCDRILVQSEGFIPYVTAVGADPQRVIYFPNWAEDLYQPVRLEEEAREDAELPGGFRVMFAGNIGVAQSFATILAAAELLKAHAAIHWVIVGDGNHKSWVEEHIRLRGLEHCVHLLGRRPIEAMPRYFALADALLVSLKRDPLFAVTIPSKVQSYLACGRPIIAALEGTGAAIIAEAGAGVVCQPEDSEGLAQAVLTLYRLSPHERHAMAQRARHYYESHFDRSILLDRLDAMLTECVESQVR